MLRRIERQRSRFSGRDVRWIDLARAVPGRGLATGVLCQLVREALRQSCELVVGQVQMDEPGATRLLSLYGHFGAQQATGMGYGSTPTTQQRLRVDIRDWTQEKLDGIAGGGARRCFLALCTLVGVVVFMLLGILALQLRPVS